jgi:hypothetical protein
MNKENLQEWKQTLLQEIEDLKARLAPIETEIRVKQEKLVAIDRLLNLETQPFEAIPALKNNSAARTTGKRKTADVAYEVLKNAGTPMHYRDLYEAILKTGFEVRGENPAANLIAHVSIDPRFKRVKRGTYALKGWRLARKKASRKKLKRRI